MSTNSEFSLVAFLVFVMTLAMSLAVELGAFGGSYETSRLAVNTFKNETLVAVGAAQNMYSEVTMSLDSTSKYTVNNNDKYSAMCVTLPGLVNNGYLDKDITNYGGVVLVEVPLDGGPTKYTVWMHNGTIGINGIEKVNINGLTEDFTKNVKDNEINGGNKAVTDNLVGIKKVVNSAYSGKTTIKSAKSRGGTGMVYNNIDCINEEIE